MLEHIDGHVKSGSDLGIVTIQRRGVCEAPVNMDRLSKPHGACFFGSGVAYCNDYIGLPAFMLIPRLDAQALGGNLPRSKIF